MDEPGSISGRDPPPPYDDGELRAAPPDQLRDDGPAVMTVESETGPPEKQKGEDLEILKAPPEDLQGGSKSKVEPQPLSEEGEKES